MDLNTIREVKRPHAADAVVQWPHGHAWLAGGTWLFSEPQFAVDTLVDLHGFDWPDLVPSSAGLEIAATCPIGAMEIFAGPPEWTAVPLFRECVHSLLMSFKIARVATVGGNVCMALPAGAMTSLTAALEGVCTLWPRSGPPREVAVVDFVAGNHANVLLPGELLRSIFLPATALAKRFAVRHASLVHLGRSAALIIGTQSRALGDFRLTITAATPRPRQLAFGTVPSADALRGAIQELVGDDWFDDVNGTPAYKRHITFAFAEQIRAELARPEQGRAA